MSYGMEYSPVAAQAASAERVAFIRRTYLHLGGAILAFAALEAVLLHLPITEQLVGNMLFGAGRMTWLLVLLAFMGVSWLATSWAQSAASPGLQYAGLGLYVVAEAVLFLPLLFVADKYFADQHVIATAGILTLAIFVGLSAAVLVTGHDFSYLRTYLMIGSFIALGVIVAGMLLGFSLGLFFCFAMVALSCGYIVYQTSNILHHYRTEQYVAAALALFASVALLFWYILQILMSTSRR
jgi:FtsH-binding integral membrane protein